MAINIAPKSLDTDLSELMRDVASGKAQLPEFQRSWTWDDNRIIGILASLSQGYPMGAIMRLTYGNENVKFKYRTIEGVTAHGVVPDYLVLDGQQRLTSMYRATCCKDPVNTTTEKGKNIKRYYYLDIKKCLDESEDREDAVFSVPADRKVKTNFDRDVVLDLSTRELEYVHARLICYRKANRYADVTRFQHSAAILALAAIDEIDPERRKRLVSAVCRVLLAAFSEGKGIEPDIAGFLAAFLNCY